MRGSSWIVAIAIVAVGFGFGHFGCYTSGTPGGLGAGGAPDAAAPGIASGGDASTTGGAATCQSNAQCVGRNDKKNVCSGDGGSCIECLVQQRLCPAAGSGCGYGRRSWHDGQVLPAQRLPIVYKL